MKEHKNRYVAVIKKYTISGANTIALMQHRPV